MIEFRRDRDIHAEDGGWFKARWHFSFDHYRDARNMALGALRVFNDDRLAPGAIWPMHPHRDVEGITYVVEGLFRHADNVGGGGVLEPGAVQRMTLGSGALHSEQNGSETKPMRFLQFWILPAIPDLPPGVEQRQFRREDRLNRLLEVLAPEGGHAVKVHQDARAFVAELEAGVEVTHVVREGRGAYAYLMDGEAVFDGEPVSAGDAAKVFGPHELHAGGRRDAHLILVDVPLEFERVGMWGRVRE